MRRATAPGQQPNPPRNGSHTLTRIAPLLGLTLWIWVGCAPQGGTDTPPVDASTETSPPEDVPSMTPTTTPPKDTPTPPPDADGDGVSSEDGDCDEGDASTYPGALEQVDGRDNDCDGHIDEGTTASDDDGDGFSEDAGDCDDSSASAYPGADELPDGVDNDCNDTADDHLDLDSDGFSSEEGDCDDSHPEIYPGAAELPYDEVDQDCDGDDLNDQDSDGYAGGSGNDCDDRAAQVNPGASEICNGIDDNCDGYIDESGDGVFYRDEDLDGFGNSEVLLQGCSGTTGIARLGGDCDDTRSTVYPGASERCNQLDDDCDQLVDEQAGPTWYVDEDLDGFGDSSSAFQSCDANQAGVQVGGDCNDHAAYTFPGAEELCNAQDDDCDGLIDEGLSRDYFQDADGDGFGNAAVVATGCAAASGFVDQAGDCNDQDSSAYPDAEELCDGVDQSCDGVLDEGLPSTAFYVDQDQDGYGTLAGEVYACAAPPGCATQAGDCDDSSAQISPSADELCDGADQNCDGQVDEGVELAYYPDADGDGYGDATATPRLACSASAGTVSNAQDCDDSSGAVSPQAREVANALDDDCDGQVDEEVYFKSCQAILQFYPNSVSGTYTIDPGQDNRALPVYCRMDRYEQAGWTLCASFGHQKRMNGLDYASSEWYYVKGRSVFMSYSPGASVEFPERVEGFGNFCTRMNVSEVYGQAMDNAYDEYFRTTIMPVSSNPFVGTGYRSAGSQGGLLSLNIRSSMQPNGQYFEGPGCNSTSNVLAQGTDLCLSNGVDRYQLVMGNPNGNTSAYDYMCAKSGAGGNDADNAVLIFVR